MRKPSQPKSLCWVIDTAGMITMFATHAPACAQFSGLRNAFCKTQGKTDLEHVHMCSKYRNTGPLQPSPSCTCASRSDPIFSCASCACYSPGVSVPIGLQQAPRVTVAFHNIKRFGCRFSLSFSPSQRFCDCRFCKPQTIAAWSEH